MKYIPFQKPINLNEKGSKMSYPRRGNPAVDSKAKKVVFVVKKFFGYKTLTNLDIKVLADAKHAFVAMANDIDRYLIVRSQQSQGGQKGHRRKLAKKGQDEI
jgi:hypothetical protein